MLFALICTDKSDGFDLRAATRPAHVAYLNSLGDTVKLAGPFLNDEGKSMGTLAVISARDLDEARQIAGRDPYAVAGLFDSVDIRPWNWLIKNPEAL